MNKYTINITTSKGEVHEIDRVIECHVADTVAVLLSSLHINPRYCTYPDIAKIEILASVEINDVNQGVHP
jgi:hypothetical protein